MRLSIEDMRGTWRAQSESRTYFDDTLEGLLVQLAPEAPEEYLWHTAEVLGAILGAEVVEIPQMSQVDFQALADAIFGDQDAPEHWESAADDGRSLVDELLAERREEAARENESWQPTEAQQAYFEGERTEEVENFTAPEIEDARPDEYPRGV